MSLLFAAALIESKIRTNAVFFFFLMDVAINSSVRYNVTQFLAVGWLDKARRISKFTEVRVLKLLFQTTADG